ncbi:MAG: SAM-dependent methyltransferase, partial [Chloroflexi bacterium]|nr:SAM-dependent methyltransferase [Chloroflexota bacterium]
MTSSPVISLLEKAIDSRLSLMDSQHESAFRLFNGFTEGFPALALDVYAHTLVIHDYADGPNPNLVREVADFIKDSLTWLHAGIVKTRNGKTQEEKRGQLIFGEKPDRKIKEHGIWYAVGLMMNR